jgi:hypothetical protein
MARVKFSADYNHRWPSGAETAYKAGWEGTVKAEVVEAATAAGKARTVRAPAKPSDGTKAPRKRRRRRASAPATLPGNLPAELAEPQALTPNLHDQPE